MLNNIVLYRYTMFYLGCFHFLAVMSNTAMSINVQVFFFDMEACFQFSWVHTREVNCCMMPSLILYPAPPPLILHKVQSQGGSIHPQAHGFRSPVPLPTLLFPLKSSSLSSFWVQIFCVIQDPAQMSLPPLLPPVKVM